MNLKEMRAAARQLEQPPTDTDIVRATRVLVWFSTKSPNVTPEWKERLIDAATFINTREIV